MLNVDRIILHIDLDCFYAAVEHVRLGIPRAVPLAVQQWEGLIAVNYAARAAGVIRHDRVAEAKRKCPDLKLVHVETIGCAAGASRTSGKVSLERYRQASIRIFNVFKRLAPVCERAGIDEAYFDISLQVEELMKQSIDWDAENSKLLYQPEGFREPSVEFPGGGMVVMDGPLLPCNTYDRRLLAGSMVACQIQAAVVGELGYTISVGVTCNKLLAKIASGMNKPSRITVVCCILSPCRDKTWIERKELE